MCSLACRGQNAVDMAELYKPERKASDVSVSLIEDVRGARSIDAGHGGISCPRAKTPIFSSSVHVWYAVHRTRQRLT